MNEKKQFILFLLTRDTQYLPDGFPDEAKTFWLARNNIDRMREARRLTVDIIKELKLNSAVAVGESTFNLDTRGWCPPQCV